MRTWTRSAAAVALLAAATLTPSSPAAAACREADDVVLASNAHVRVVGDWIECDGEPGRSYFGVSAGLRPDGPMHSLDYLGDDAVEIHSLRVRGRYVAYVSDWQEGEEEAAEFSLINARTGAIHRLDFTSYATANAFGSFVLKPNGSTAWIVTDVTAAGDEPRIHVKRCPRASCLRTRAQRPATVDSGRRIRMSSLRLSGSRISWLDGGTRRRSTLR